MKPVHFVAAFIFTLGCLSLGCQSASALTNADIAGVYQGTSVATLPNGQTATGTGTFTFKSNGKFKAKVAVNGQTTASKGKYQFISEFALVENVSGGEAIAYADLDGNALTFDVLVRLDSGEIVKEVTTLTLINKL